eukprot:CAMPEP_0115464244 /NCGR_PEP_ID=MMETSP0271-20121206/48774_1 /TAXON_ID=71861 /ORGANISM="Scrippsiella trochoidea, Strain CCMP3099" /LENGTH=51 /DNA_ID=CAMNT_0002891125 /DNA_START=673 /DNA_END=825 /DNA_ORIENTATION=+
MSVEDEGGGVVAEPAASQGTGHMTPSSMGVRLRELKQAIAEAGAPGGGKRG